jgi:transcription termination factor Rho
MREEPAEEPVIEGVVELISGGSGFVRVSPPEPSDDDVYISAAQVKRCELVSGDRVSGPKRPPRRSERFASMIRIETINDRPATELADSVRFDDLPAAFPSELLKLGSGDPTLKVIEGVTPFGKGSRVSIVGAARSGKTETLKRLARALAEQDGLSVQVVLAGARPEEIAEWSQDAEAPTAPAATSSLTASEEVINSSIEAVIDQGRRLAARGSDAVVLIDSLDGASRSMARRALGAARNIVDGGSLTVIATASAPVGGETTVIALDVIRAAAAKFPALDVLASGVLRPELLVGDRGAKAIARAHAEAATPEKK